VTVVCFGACRRRPTDGSWQSMSLEMMLLVGVLLLAAAVLVLWQRGVR
jgi:hypothetical protein